MSRLRLENSLSRRFCRSAEHPCRCREAAGGAVGHLDLIFFLALFFWPIFVIIPPQATAPALVLVGVLMMQGLARIDMTDLGNAISIVLTLLVTVLTNNLINGMALGTLSYAALEVTVGRRSQIPAMVWGARRRIHRLRDRDGPDFLMRLLRHQVQQSA